MSGERIGVFLRSSQFPATSSALPELAPRQAGCVVIVGGGPEGTLLAVLPDESDFDEDGEEEEDTGYIFR